MRLIHSRNRDPAPARRFRVFRKIGLKTFTWYTRLARVLQRSPMTCSVDRSSRYVRNRDLVCRATWRALLIGEMVSAYHCDPLINHRHHRSTRLDRDRERWRWWFRGKARAATWLALTSCEPIGKSNIKQTNVVKKNNPLILIAYTWHIFQVLFNDIHIISHWYFSRSDMQRLKIYMVL